MEMRDMTKKKLKKLRSSHLPKLEPIIYDRDLSAFDRRHYVDLYDLNLVLSDFDWENCEISARISTKEYGDMKIEFKYYGCTSCAMAVETEKGKYSFSFSTAIFEKYIIRFLYKHLRNWKEKSAFDGLGEVVDFYNDVLTSPCTVEEEAMTLKHRKYKIIAKKNRR